MANRLLLNSGGIFVRGLVCSPHPASFRFKVTLDTLAFDYILPTTRRIPDLHRLETCAAGGSAGTAGGKFYVDELQAAIFLVYYCDGGDVRKEEKYRI